MEQLAEVFVTTATSVQPIQIPNPPVYSMSNTHSNQYMMTNVAGSYPYYGAGNVATPRHNQQPNQFYYQPPRPYFPPAFQTGTMTQLAKNNSINNTCTSMYGIPYPL